ncbi:MAG: AAA family ATPase [Clostridiaceae bacterium]|nr:AAA family ATPase [Clostridiaceae bacterium]
MIKAKKKRVRTGFASLDRVLGGLGRGTLNILAARPSMGKSAFALNVAQQAAQLFGVTTVVFSLEMSREEIGHRLLSSQAMIDSYLIRDGKLDDSDMRRVGDSLPTYYNMKLFIDDRSGTSVIDIASQCRRLRIEHDLGLVIIDYLQLMSGNERYSGDRQQEITEISRSLKLLARDLDVPILALSQLSRNCERRVDRRPILSDLRDSGAIEQDADTVIFLYRDGYYKKDENAPNPEEEEAEIIIAKNRSGVTTTVKMMWQKKYTRFYDPDLSGRVSEEAPLRSMPQPEIEDVPATQEETTPPWREI